MAAREGGRVSLTSLDQTFDLLIIGGGITGAALAYLATQARPPMRVALLEADNLASGTSSRSSRFLHGGLRYLAQGRIGLVKHLLEGRAELAALAPDLVRPAPFILPLGEGNPHPAWVLRAALRLYGALERRAPNAGGVTGARHLDAMAARKVEPLLEGVALDGALTYGELTVDDAGLVRALAQGARAAGALVRTHVRCTGLLRSQGKVVGIVAHDLADGNRSEVRARAVIDATGPWSGRWQESHRDRDCGPGAARGSDFGRERERARGRSPGALRLARGTHVVLPAAALPLGQTLVFFAPRDRRALFASPRGSHVVVGTTDVEHHGAPGDVAPTRGEVAYLLEALAAALPAMRVARPEIVTAFAGVRALAASRGRNPSKTTTGTLDRDYVVAWDEPGLLAVRGGKLTLALHGARRALAALKSARHALGLPDFVVPPVGALPGPLPASVSTSNPSSTHAEPFSPSDWRAA
jgi:glycerol-3-phosphate dehydrogenase